MHFLLHQHWCILYTNSGGNSAATRSSVSQHQNSNSVAPIIPPIKCDCRIDDHPCRIFHASQEDVCKSCKETGHKTGSMDCPALDNSDTILAFKSYENVLSNFYLCDISWAGEIFASVEHAYQWTKATELDKHDLAIKIKNAKHAGAAKAISRKGISREEAESWEGHSEKIMRDLLESKAENCPHFRETLIKSGTKILAEATGNTFWATGLDVRTTSLTKPDYWPGSNMLGMMLMDLRDSLTIQDQTLPNQSGNQSEIVGEVGENDDTQSEEEENDITTSPSQNMTKTPEKTSFLRKVSSIFKQPQTNTMDKYVTSEKKNKRRQSTTPPKPSQKKAKTDDPLSDETENYKDKEHKTMLHSATVDEHICENTNHKPGNK